MTTIVHDIDALDFHRTDSGMIVSDAKLARSGIQVYLAGEPAMREAFADRDPTDQIRVYRSPEEVFSEDALASLEGLPITIDHRGDFVDADNASGLVVGHLGDKITRDGNHIAARVYLTHAEGISAFEKGRKQLSIGYSLELVAEDGTTPDGESYEAIQKNIRGNHVSLVERGRCGPSCRVQDHGIDCDCPSIEGNQMADQLFDIVCKGITVKVSEIGKQAISLMVADHDTVVAGKDAELATGVAKIATLDAQVATLEAGKKDLEKKLADAEAKSDPKALADAASKLASVGTDAKTIAKDLDTAGMSPEQIKRAALKAIDIDVEGKSDAYVDASFDAYVKIAKDGGGAADTAARRLGGATSPNQKTAADAEQARTDARGKYMTEAQDAYNLRPEA